MLFIILTGIPTIEAIAWLKRAAKTPTKATRAPKTSSLFKAGLFLYLISKSGPVQFNQMLSWFSGSTEKKIRNAVKQAIKKGIISVEEEG